MRFFDTFSISPEGYYGDSHILTPHFTHDTLKVNQMRRKYRMLKNKDGSSYSLRKPNPLGISQKTFAVDKLRLHNFRWKSQTIFDDSPDVKPITRSSVVVTPEKSKPVIEVIETDIPPVVEIEESNFIPVVEEELTEMPVIVAEKALEPEASPIIEKKHSKIKHRVIFHCLPVTYNKTKTDFYEEDRTKASYGDKFTFEGVVVNHTDLAILFWTNAEPVSKGSIIFPSTITDGKNQKKYGEYRWWKVVERTKERNGWLMRAIPTEVQPDFS